VTALNDVSRTASIAAAATNNTSITGMCIFLSIVIPSGVRQAKRSRTKSRACPELAEGDLVFETKLNPEPI
jgi:hypothetical protein